LVANEEAIEIPMENEGHDEKFGKNKRYPKRGSGVELENGGKITFYPNTVKYGANVTLLDDHLNLYKALRSKDTSKWKAAMQEEYDSLITNGM
jgi:hypothetical protein